METLKFIKAFGLEALTEALGIIVKEEEGLLCLNYDQLNSPKLHPVVQECRGLILEPGTLEIVFRSMSRFYNYAETGCLAKFNNDTKYYGKIDGSYIKIFNYNSRWYVATRGTVFANNHTPAGTIFSHLVYKALGVKSYEEFSDLCDECLSVDLSYGFELTSIENRVVTRYEGYKLHYLNSRNTLTGDYVDQSVAAERFGAELLEPLTFKDIDEAVAYVENLEDLQEGLVAYENGIPVAKIKNSLYLQVHRTRGDGNLTPRVIKEIVFLQEQDEYLSYFPEDQERFEPYILAYEKLVETFAKDWALYKGIEDQKEFALTVKDLPHAGLLFAKRKFPERSLVNLLSTLTNNNRLSLLEKYKVET